MNADSGSVGMIVARVIGALNELGVAHMVTGSLAVSVHATPRATKGADLVVDAGAFDAARLAARLAALLGSGFRLEPQSMFETVTMSARHLFEHVASGFVIELFVLTDDPHDLTRFDRRRPLSLFGVPTAVATAEDTVVTKLRWSRLANRRKDLDDARNVLAVQAGHLDLVHIRKWCREHGTEELLDGADLGLLLVDWDETCTPPCGSTEAMAAGGFGDFDSETALLAALSSLGFDSVADFNEWSASVAADKSSAILNQLAAMLSR